MINISNKISTLRLAKAVGSVIASGETLDRVKKNQTPKKDVLVVARTAGLMAVKKTGELIPYCHPIPIEAAELNLKVLEEKIHIEALVSTIGKTGVEMEALTACSVAALNLYDLLKPIDKSLVIGESQLVNKVGGKTSFHFCVPEEFKAHLLVTSQGVALGTREDRAGRLLTDKFKEIGVLVDYEVIAPHREAVCQRLKQLADSGIDMVVTVGGTGLNDYDETVEATRDICSKEIPGISHRLQEFGQSRTPVAMLSRGIAGIIDRTLVINLPGSRRGAEEGFDALFPYLFHSIPMLRQKKS